MIWAHKRVANDEIRSVELLFREQAQFFDRGRQMLLVSVDEAWPSVRLWVCVPEPDLLTPYFGFALCTRADLPAAPALVAGCVEQFALLFQS